MKFYIQQKVFSFKDQFSIYDENQTLKYQVKGKFVSLSNKLQFLDANGELLYKAHRKIFTFLPKYFVFDDKEQEVAEIQRQFSFRPRFKVFVNYKELDVTGNLFAHSFVVEDGGVPLATIQKRIIAWGDTYEIEILNDDKPELMLFLVILLDQVIHPRN